jgi:hypothetical protein
LRRHGKTLHRSCGRHRWDRGCCGLHG